MLQTAEFDSDAGAVHFFATGGDSHAWRRFVS
jgi:hypothetical protein